MTSYKNEQRRVTFRGRDFHFVSYDGHPANERTGQPAEPPMWYLMNAGKRFPVMPQVAGQEASDVDRALTVWLRDQGLGTPIGS